MHTEREEAIRNLTRRELSDLLNAEEQTLKLLEKWKREATNESLVILMDKQYEQIKLQIRQLRIAFELFETSPDGLESDPVLSIIPDGMERVKEEDLPGMKDLARAFTIQKINHYQMAGYQTCALFTASVKQVETANILNEIREEMRFVNRRLRDIIKDTLKQEEEVLTE